MKQIKGQVTSKMFENSWYIVIETLDTQAPVCTPDSYMGSAKNDSHSMGEKDFLYLVPSNLKQLDSIDRKSNKNKLSSNTNRSR